MIPFRKTSNLDEIADYIDSDFPQARIVDQVNPADSIPLMIGLQASLAYGHLWTSTLMVLQSIPPS